MSYQTEFPDFVLDVAIPEGFRDDSYRNDACPRFARELPNGNTLTLWVDFADRSMSDFPNEPRFVAELSAWNGDDIETLSSDNWQDILNFVAEYV